MLNLQVTIEKWISVRCFKQYSKCYRAMEIFSTCKLFFMYSLNFKKNASKVVCGLSLSGSYSFTEAFFNSLWKQITKNHSMDTTVNYLLLIFMLFTCIDSCWWLLLNNVHVTLLHNSIVWYFKMFKYCNNWNTRLNLKMATGQLKTLQQKLTFFNSICFICYVLFLLQVVFETLYLIERYFPFRWPMTSVWTKKGVFQER